MQNNKLFDWSSFTSRKERSLGIIYTKTEKIYGWVATMFIIVASIGIIFTSKEKLNGFALFEAVAIYGFLLLTIPINNARNRRIKELMDNKNAK